MIKFFGVVQHLAFGVRIDDDLFRRAVVHDAQHLVPCLGVDRAGVLVDFDTLLAEADVISIHMNLTEENYHMFNKETFRKCKKQPIIVNEGRGALISDDDLLTPHSD